eukprot:366573-Chlamydomonas_euryale.AAC.24
MRLGLSVSSRGAALPPRRAASRPPAAAPLAGALGPHHLALPGSPAAGIAAPRPSTRRAGARCAASIREFIESECPVAGGVGIRGVRGATVRSYCA